MDTKQKKMKWVTINKAHVPIEDGEPQYPSENNSLKKVRKIADKKRKESEKKRLRARLVDRLRKVAEKKKSEPRTIEVDLTADIQRQFDNATPEERRDIAFKYIMDNLRGKYPTNDGRIVAIEKVGAKKIKNTLNEVKIRVIPELDELIKSGQFQYIKEDKGNKHKNFKSFAYYKVSFKVGNEVYKGMLNVGIRENGDSTLYELNQIVKK